MFSAEIRRFFGFDAGQARLQGVRSTSAALIMLPLLVRDLLASVTNSSPAPEKLRVQYRVSAAESWKNVGGSYFIQLAHS